MDSPEIRIGDTERAEALNLLGEHFSHGRLNLSEFEERSAQATAATTRGELEILFTDLPHVAANTPDTVQEKDTASGTLGHWREIVMGLTPLLALVLFFAFDTWLWFLLVPAVSIVLYAGRNDDEDDEDDEPEKKN
ncbi:DUF1707 SHOCT-like domain-containing protein [Rhodococcus artemisiae]|uniref:DUF1707 domain-containing protein n=1 Tax=Rhodococcus artemisiae TaxID=714159 RepID=A0ABU7L7I8_9NOCA|nr:DUF1707 domain-containing protein [Rhodococcus artemisiae]MEE2057493.1 DUF1707 domain-containing protein [Rhodococcus artemisiae]